MSFSLRWLGCRRWPCLRQSPGLTTRPGMEELEPREVLSGFGSLLDSDLGAGEQERFLSDPSDQARAFSLAAEAIVEDQKPSPTARFAAPGPGFAVYQASDPGPRLSRGSNIPAPPPSVGGNTVFIDGDWLSAHASGPYVLDEAGTTYVLGTDVRTAGTSFVVGAPGVTLDLNGHTIVYGDTHPLSVTNGGFESGSGRNVPGWDLSSAPAATVADNTSLLFGGRVLHLGPFQGVQRIVSDPIDIPETGRPYTATITPAGVDTHSTVTLSVLDAVTGKVLGKGTSDAAFRGFSAVATFTPKTDNPVRLQIEVRPQGHAADAIDLDQATLTVAGDHAIMATRVSSSEILGWKNLPARARSVYRQAADFTIRNGTIQQGQGDGYDSSALFFRDLPGVTVENVQVYSTGTDTTALDATYARGIVVVRDSTFEDDIDNITNRMDNHATLKLNNTSANILIENNRILGSPQAGIVIARNDPAHSVRIIGNEIRQSAVVTNGYGILFSGVQNFEISGNTIAPANGRGIDLDGYSTVLLANGIVSNNHVEVQESANREYPRGLEAVALRLRNNVGNVGTHHNLLIQNNTFSAQTGPGLAAEAYGVRISYVNPDGAMNNAGIRLEGNLIQAIVEGSDPAYGARALVVERLDRGIGLQITGNVVQSNDTAVALSGGRVDPAGFDPAANVVQPVAQPGIRGFTRVAIE
jgi:Right handed beta helix region